MLSHPLYQYAQIAGHGMFITQYAVNAAIIAANWQLRKMLRYKPLQYHRNEMNNKKESNQKPSILYIQ
jgi:uncharacterized membrane protein YqjE